MSAIPSRRMTIVLVIIVALGPVITACGASPAATVPVIDSAIIIERAKAWTGSDWLEATDTAKLQIAGLWNDKIRAEYGRDLGAEWWSDSLTTFYLCGNIEDDPNTDCRGGKQGAFYLGMTVHMALDSVCVVDLELCPDHYYDESSW